MTFCEWFITKLQAPLPQMSLTNVPYLTPNQLFEKNYHPFTNERIACTITLYILWQTLSHAPRHGYYIVKHLSQMSKGLVIVLIYGQASSNLLRMSLPYVPYLYRSRWVCGDPGTLWPGVHQHPGLLHLLLSPWLRLQQHRQHVHRYVTLYQITWREFGNREVEDSLHIQWTIHTTNIYY